ncbi:hypothetical protein H311_02651 [Anncaliia algerae PRA109]|nr:hypothetical protein H311_02651 [Anncaliia algerae PRA109]
MYLFLHQFLAIEFIFRSKGIQKIMKWSEQHQNEKNNTELVLFLNNFKIHRNIEEDKNYLSYKNYFTTYEGFKKCKIFILYGSFINIFRNRFFFDSFGHVYLTHDMFEEKIKDLLSKRMNWIDFSVEQQFLSVLDKLVM